MTVGVSDGAEQLQGADARELLATMWRIRALEERVGRLKRADEVYGLIHLSIGQEATAAAICSQLTDADLVYSGHRAHGHALAKGAPLGPLVAELMGRDGGLCHGLGGSMHLVDAERGFMGATGVVGGNLSLAVGSALVAMLEGRRDVTVVYFGDGAVQSGHFHESVNLATLWNAPVIFVCENNGFAEFTPRSAHTVVERVSDVVAPYGLGRATVDGSDAGAVWQAFGAFLRETRDGGGPKLLECLTHRLRGHYEGDPDRYREAIGAEEWQAKDPVLRLQRTGLTENWLSEEEASALESDAVAAVEAAVEWARASPPPPLTRAAEMTYSRGVAP